MSRHFIHKDYPVKDGDALAKAIKEAINRFNAMTPEEQKAHRDAQRESWVRGEMNWPKDCPYR